MLWRKCPKFRYASFKKLRAVAALVVSEFNQGGLATLHDIEKAEDLKFPKKSFHLKELADKRRVKQSTRRVENGAKKARQLKLAAQKLSEDRKVAGEGTSYGSGMF